MNKKSLKYRIINWVDVIFLTVALAYVASVSYHPVSTLHCYPLNIEFQPGYNSASVYYQSDSRRVRLLSPLPDWISVSDGSNQFRLTVPRNDSAYREAVITIAAYSTFLGIPTGSLTQEINISQRKDM